MWAVDQTADASAVESFAAPFRARGGRVVFVELEATQEQRLRRNETPLRLAEKPFKRDLAASRARFVADDATYRLNSHGAFDARDDNLRLQTITLSAVEVAECVIAHFRLPRLPDNRLATQPGVAADKSTGDSYTFACNAVALQQNFASECCRSFGYSRVEQFGGHLFIVSTQEA